jgi:hypothetical protein
MDDGTWIIFPLFLFQVVWTSGWYNYGNYNGAKESVDMTTIQCIEKPNVCKDRYQYMKLGEKLEKIK